MRINATRVTALLALLGVVGSPVAARAQGIGFVTAGAALADLGNHNTALQVGGGAEVLSGPLGIGGGIDLQRPTPNSQEVLKPAAGTIGSWKLDVGS
jgi:hypothetical protein